MTWVLPPVSSQMTDLDKEDAHGKQEKNEDTRLAMA